MKLWDRIQRGMEEGFDSAISTVHKLTEKAGESIELTRLRREKTRLGTQLTRSLAELGNFVYEKVSQEQLDDLIVKLGIKEKLVEVAKMEAQMVDIDKKLGVEIDN
jgi:hypothetical protein